MLIEYLGNFLIPSKKNNFKPKILEVQFFFILLSVFIGIKALSIMSFQGYLGANIFNEISQQDLYVLINQARNNNKIPELAINSKLEMAAQLKLNDMFNNNYFGHISPSGTTPWNWFDRAKYDYKIAGENLAMDFVSSDQVVKAWLNSESHRKNILLKDFNETGIAIGSGLINGQKTIAVVQVFGKEQVAIVPVAKAKVNNKTISTTSPNPRINPKTSVVSKTKALSLKPINTPSVKGVNSSSVSNALDSKYLAYFSNDTLNKVLTLFVVFCVLILSLKVLVAVHIQFPALILRAIILIIVSVSILSIKDSRFIGKELIIGDGGALITNSFQPR